MKLTGKINKETEKAYMIEGGWVPKSQLENVKIENGRIDCDAPEWVMKSFNKNREKYKTKNLNEKYQTKEDKEIEALMIKKHCQECKKDIYMHKDAKICIWCHIKLQKQSENRKKDK